jgi:pseudaminic acid cytidylyltransferase
MNIVIVPARSGSKRIKNKNIKKFIDEPIILKTIKNLIKMKMFGKIFVSTDSKKIFKIVQKIKKVEIINRPKKLSDDYAGTREVVVHAIKKISKNFEFKKVYCVYPTSIFLKKNNIILANKILKEKNYIFSASPVNKSFLRSFYFDKKNKLQLYNKKNYYHRTQDLVNLHYDVGQFYLANKETWLKNKIIFDHNCKFVEIPKNRAYDIDDPEDWKFAEKLYKINDK